VHLVGFSLQEEHHNLYHYYCGDETKVNLSQCNSSEEDNISVHTCCKRQARKVPIIRPRGGMENDFRMSI
jgi:hypothetical protein